MKAWKKSVLGSAMAGALLVGGGTAPAQAAEVVSAGNGTIASRGLIVTGTYTADCDYAGQKISSAIDLYQNVRGGTIVQNWTSDDFVCKTDGLVTRTYTIYNNSGTAYKSGHATLRVGMFYANESGEFDGTEDIGWFDIRLGNK